MIEGSAVGSRRCIFGRRRSVVIASSFVGLFAAACGTSSSSTSSTSQGSATINGTVNGQSVTANDVIGLTGTEMKDASTNAYAAVIISNQTGTCGRAHSSVWDGSPGYEVLVIDAVVSGASSVSPGTYPVGSTGVAQLTVVHADGTTAGNAGDGTITFSAVGSMLVGSFDVNLAGGFHLTGQFTAPVCAGGLDPFPT